MRIWGQVHGELLYVEADTQGDGEARLAELDARPALAPRKARPACIRCGAPATMSASMGPACPDCYDELAD